MDFFKFSNRMKRVSFNSLDGNILLQNTIMDTVKNLIHFLSLKKFSLEIKILIAYNGHNKLHSNKISPRKCVNTPLLYRYPTKFYIELSTCGEQHASKPELSV